ncbi:hypothetical protein E2320_013305, partial [Naja naja]
MVLLTLLDVDVSVCCEKRSVARTREKHFSRSLRTLTKGQAFPCTTGLRWRSLNTYIAQQSPPPQRRPLIKPTFTEKQAAELVRRIFGLEVSQLRPLPSYDDQNFHVAAASFPGKGESPGDFVLKIINAEDSQNSDLIEVQTQIMMFLNGEDTGSCTQKFVVRLLSYLPGKTVATLPVTPPILYDIGQMAAKLDKTLAEKFQHPLIKSLHRGEFIWNLSNVPLLKKYLYALGKSEYLEAVKQVMEQFQVNVIPKLSFFRS